MQLIRFKKLILFVFVFVFILLNLFIFSLKNSYGFSVKANTFVVVPKKQNEYLQSIGIKKGIKAALKNAVILLIGKRLANDKKNNYILNKEIYSHESKFIYSFRIIKAKKYLNLFYIKLSCNIRKGLLMHTILANGFKLKKFKSEKKIVYSIYRVKFIGNYRYADINKLEKLMIKYSNRLKNIYISSFSNDFVEIKVKYRGSLLRLLKSVKQEVDTYLNSNVYVKKNGVIYVDIKD